MFREDLVMKNVSVLERLAQSDATLEELAQSINYGKRSLSSSLQILQQQGLISQTDGRYHVAEPEATAKILETVQPWISYFKGQFYEIARDTARIIHEKSWEKNKVLDVLLYGSTLTNEFPNDIDLLIIHECHHSSRLRAFSPYSPLRVDEPFGDENARDSSYKIFRSLGYRCEERENDSVAVAVGKRIAALGLPGFLTAEEIAEETKTWSDTLGTKDDPYEISNSYDVHGIDTIFDVNVLDVKALQKDDELFCVTEQTTNLRSEAIASCRDPTFWHTILSKGRIYDMKTHDFSSTVADKYTGALDLFPS